MSSSSVMWKVRKVGFLSDAVQNAVHDKRLLSPGWIRPARANLWFSSEEARSANSAKPRAKTPFGKLDQESAPKDGNDPYAPFPNNTNPQTGEIGGPTGPEPTRYGDWERKGRVTDF